MQTPNTATPLDQQANLNLGELLKVEAAVIKQRRIAKGEHQDVRKDSFAIALSGGGIRSATICLGLMKQLNKIGLLEKADYLSSVSGGGYLASYIHMARNKTNPTPYSELFSDEVIKHLRDYRTHLYRFPKYKLLSNLILGGRVLIAFIGSWLWLIVPLVLFFLLDLAYWEYGLLAVFGVVIACVLSPNLTSLHHYYRNRLRKAYLWQDKGIKLKDLTNIHAPYPLINGTIHVNKDDYDQADTIKYRGNINSNYFLFSPLYCGSQVTRYAKSDGIVYEKMSLATAMATSGAAVNTFMGNTRLLAPLRWLMIVFNIRIGLLAPSPLLKKRRIVFWPWYTLLEFFGKAKTSSYKIQVSDGGHIENLGVYELLRRKVKTIIAIDCGEDNQFGFFDLRNLTIRAKNELGVVIEFEEDANPLTDIKPSLITGTSKKHFSIAKISGIKGSYAEGYEGIFVYVKSSVLNNRDFKVRALKKELEVLRKEIEGNKKTVKKGLFEAKRRELDHTMYRTYTPDFPHQTTVDQFFSGEQWDAYYELGKKMGDKIIEDIELNETDSRLDLFKKCAKSLA